MLRTLKIGLHKYATIFLMKSFLEGGEGVGGRAFIRREHLKKGALIIFF